MVQELEETVPVGTARLESTQNLAEVLEPPKYRTQKRQPGRWNEIRLAALARSSNKEAKAAQKPVSAHGSRWISSLCKRLCGLVWTSQTTGMLVRRCTTKSIRAMKRGESHTAEFYKYKNCRRVSLRRRSQRVKRYLLPKRLQEAACRGAPKGLSGSKAQGSHRATRQPRSRQSSSQVKLQHRQHEGPAATKTAPQSSAPREIARAK